MTPIEQLTDKFLEEVSTIFYQYLEQFPDERETFSILETQFETRDKELCSRKNMTGHLTASGLLLHPDGQSVFLIHHNFLKLWLQPGGHLDREESPADGAIREFIEETGKNVALHPWHDKHPFPFDMDTHAIPPHQKKNEGSHFHHDYQYLLCLSAGDQKQANDLSVDIDQNEVSNYRWFLLTEIIEGNHDSRLKRAAQKILRLSVQV
jgi:8-oxo-dGTP pyrophosphatase MutT (NUDIX family)